MLIHTSLPTALPLRTFEVAVELVEHLDKREALEVGDRRLELDETVSAILAVAVCLFSSLFSL